MTPMNNNEGATNVRNAEEEIEKKGSCWGLAKDTDLSRKKKIKEKQSATRKTIFIRTEPKVRKVFTKKSGAEEFCRGT